jgi:hypothetical protein
LESKALPPLGREHDPAQTFTRFEPPPPNPPKPAWLRRPGTASILMPRAGTAQEWMTSLDVTRRRTFWVMGGGWVGGWVGG